VLPVKCSIPPSLLRFKATFSHILRPSEILVIYSYGAWFLIRYQEVACDSLTMLEVREGVCYVKVIEKFPKFQEQLITSQLSGIGFCE